MPTKLKPLPPATTLPQDSGPSPQAVQQPDSRTAFPFKGGETAALGNAETSFWQFHSFRDAEMQSIRQGCGMWIRIDFMRIRSQHFSYLRIRIQFRIQGFDDQKYKKNLQV